MAFVVVDRIQARDSESAGPASSVAAILAQPGEPEQQIAPPPHSPNDPATTPEQKRKARSAAVLLSVLAAIALTGLLLIIVAVSVRGLQRKLAGPTRIDREPQDILSDAVSRAEESQQPAEPHEDRGAAADDTQYT